MVKMWIFLIEGIQTHSLVGVIVTDLLYIQWARKVYAAAAEK
jgi:hypothetical protein